MNKDIIKQAKNGSYYFRASLGFDPNTGKRIQKKMTGFKTKTAAKNAYINLLANKDNVIRQTKKLEERMNFKEFTETVFLPWYKTQVKEQTYRNRVFSVKKHFKPFNKYYIDKITPLMVQKWQVNLVNQGYATMFIHMIQGTLIAEFDRAIVLGLIKENPAKIAGHVKKIKKPVDFWTKEEFEKVIAQIYVDDFYQNFLFITIWLLFMTGMRIGEATALQWSDINLDEGTIKVDKTLIYYTALDYHFSEPKTKAGNRIVTLDLETIRLLREWQEVQRKYINSTFVLSYNSAPTQKYTISAAIDRFSKLAGVHRIRIHALRHSHAALLIRMGENPLIIKERLGHADIQTTLGTYGHLYPNSNFEIAHRLNGIVKLTTAKSDYAQSPKNGSTAHLTPTVHKVCTTSKAK